MKIAKTLSERMTLRDSVSMTIHQSPELFLGEFGVYEKKYLDQNANKDLIMAYILLQIYIEDHLHYFLRFLVGGGFSFTLPDWKEEDTIYKKLNWFKDYLFKNSFVLNEKDFQELGTDIHAVSSVRNKFVHGHAVTEKRGEETIIRSEAKEFLTRQKFSEIRKVANDLTDRWNKIMCELQNQEHLLRLAKLPTKNFLNDCKFKVFY